MRSIVLPLIAACALLSACQPGASDAPPAEDTAAAAEEVAAVPGDTDETAPYSAIAEDEVLRFTGTEPFWGGEVGGKTLTYKTPEDQDGTEIAVERFAGRGGIAFSGELGGADFEMTVTSLECSDGMSDRTYPFTVRLEIGEDQRNGCAWSEEHPFEGPEHPSSRRAGLGYIEGMMSQPSLFIPHGGGPCFFMPDPSGTWTRMGDYLRSLPATLPEPPRAILVISGHWEEPAFAFTGAEHHPGLIFDYYGFPPETYRLTWPAAGAPWLAERGAQLLREAGLPAAIERERGFDHGVFVPLKVMFAQAEVPVVQMSLHASLDPALHVAAGEALAPLREEGVLVLGSGMSFHNLRAMGDPRVAEPSRQFDRWLVEAAASGPAERADRLARWAEAPYARLCHPREEHLLPLMVAAGASAEPGTHDYGELVLGGAVSAFRFG